MKLEGQEVRQQLLGHLVCNAIQISLQIEDKRKTIKGLHSMTQSNLCLSIDHSGHFVKENFKKE